MYGTGFAPKQEILLLLLDTTDVRSVIMSSTLKPAPVPNKEGAWATEWNIARYLRTLKPGTVMIAVTDNEYNTLDQIPVTFVAPPKKKDAPKRPCRKLGRFLVG